jgi:hypothetical protein
MVYSSNVVIQYNNNAYIQYINNAHIQLLAVIAKKLVEFNNLTQKINY